MYAVPNGARTNSQSQANKLKAEGMKSGVPDLVLPFPIRVSADSDQWFHGLYIEMKRQKGGRLSENQSNYMAYLKSVGYCVLVCAGAEQAVNTIKTYLTNPEALLDFEH